MSNNPQTSFYSENELKQIGFASVGKNVCISRFARFYGAGKMEIGDNVRIDDFTVLSGKVRIGHNVHIAVYSAVFGADKGVVIEDFANISSRVCVYSISDDFSGKTMSNPTVPDEFKDVMDKEVYIGRHAIIGTGSTVLPGVTMYEGSVLGAMSLLKNDASPWTIWGGVPAVKIKDRKRDLLELEKKYLEMNA